MNLPDRPDHPVYADIAADIQSVSGDEQISRMREMAKTDYWWYCRTITSLNEHYIQDSRHPLYREHDPPDSVGRLWIDHPWLFDRCREIQEDIENGTTQKFYNWPRFHFKTTLITQHSIGWQLVRDKSLTFAILTYKVENVGDTMLGGVRDEWLNNPLYHQLWPEIWPAEKKGYVHNSGERIKLPCTTAREPTVSIHALDNMPTSFHVDRIFVDDAEVREVVSSGASVEKMDDNLKHITALQNERSTTVYVGTIWDEDGPWMRRVKSGAFTERSHWTCFGRPDKMDDKVPCLQSGEMIAEWFRTMGPYVASCQLLGIPTAKHRQSLHHSWLVRYQNDPKEEAKGKSVYIFVDFAGDGTGRDYLAIFVVGLGADKNFYALDLWREKIGMIHGIDLLFNLVAFWQPRRVFVEQFGSAGQLEAIKAEQERRGYRFSVDRLPKITHRSKEGRIELYGQFQSQKKMFWPSEAFGHGSPATGDKRDTFDQFTTDEYSKWTPVKGSTLTDDMLDAVAWSTQPEVRGMMRFPVFGNPDDPHDPRRRRSRQPFDTNWAW